MWCLDPMNSPELMDALRPHWRPRLVDVAWVGEGWRDLVAECHRRLVDRYPAYELQTIEDRDGELRFVASPGPGRDDEAAVAELLDPVVARAAVTCTWCGSAGSKRSARSCVLVLCDPCSGRFPDPTGRGRTEAERRHG